MNGEDGFRGESLRFPKSVAVICFERNQESGERIAAALAGDYPEVECVGYDDDVFERVGANFDAIIGVMAVGIVVRKISPFLESKWEDPAVLAVDTDLQFAVPLVGGHHGANQLAQDLSTLGALPVVSTATEVTGRESVEGRARTLDSTIETPNSTVATNLAVLDDELGPVARLDGPQAVLVSDDVTVLKRTKPDGIVLGTGCRSGVSAEQCLRAWEQAIAETDRDFSAVEFVATGRLKAEEDGLFEAAKARDLGVVLFEKETLQTYRGPSESKASELVDWPGIAEASAIAGGKDHELLLQKQTYDEAVTVAVGR